MRIPITRRLQRIETDKADIILEIPASFEKDLVKENEAELSMSVNAINGVKGGPGKCLPAADYSGF